MLQRLTDVLHYPFGRVRRFVLVHMLHANDPPHRLALGAAIGVFVAITPTVGIQMALVLVLAYLLRANKVVGLPIVWMTNPATIVPIYYSCYYIGRRMLNQEGIGREWWAELRGTHNFTFYWEKLVEVAMPLWLGCLVVATVCGYATYYVTYFMVRQYRLKRWGQLTPPEHELGEAALQLPEQGAAAESESAAPAEATPAPAAPPDINASGGETDHLPTTIE
ncbi:MAG: DUF2062 domain-containing protein [Planctomycetales bacterium]|nr:DUF2062 domain-containing protein [Planctomycetales bacterium]